LFSCQNKEETSSLAKGSSSSCSGLFLYCVNMYIIEKKISSKQRKKHLVPWVRPFCSFPCYDLFLYHEYIYMLNKTGEKQGKNREKTGEKHMIAKQGKKT